MLKTVKYVSGIKCKVCLRSYKTLIGVGDVNFKELIIYNMINRINYFCNSQFYSWPTSSFQNDDCYFTICQILLIAKVCICCYKDFKPFL